MSQTARKLSIQTVGCRLNQYESERIAAQLAPYGFERANESESADLYIINTCTVTHKADADCRSLIRRASRHNPNSRIVVTGCYVDNDPSRVEGMEGVDLIVRNADKDAIATILPSRLPDLFEREPDKNCSVGIDDFHNHNRAWVKVSDGCNQWCSFCIIPMVRGRLRNRPALEIVDEINQLVANGYNEVVLTGVHLGHYKNRKTEPQVRNLAELCRMILAETDLHRLRISSIEPQTVRDEMLGVFADSKGRICRHFHLPLQSGSSRILKEMRRPYDQRTYIKRAEEIKAAVPNTIIGADVIVGFPGETDEDFEITRKLCQTGLIDYLHVFSYSDRRDTYASQLPDKVHPEIIKERNAILSRLSFELRAAAHKRQVGQTLEVIAEHKIRGGAFHWAIADNYIKARVPANSYADRAVIRFAATGATDDFVTGAVVA